MAELSSGVSGCCSKNGDYLTVTSMVKRKKRPVLASSFGSQTTGIHDEYPAVERDTGGMLEIVFDGRASGNCYFEIKMCAAELTLSTGTAAVRGRSTGPGGLCHRFAQDRFFDARAQGNLRTRACGLPAGAHKGTPLCSSPDLILRLS